MSELVTLRVPVSTVLTTELAGYTGSARCIVIVNGEVELGVDLEQARFEDVNPEARTATLFLPEPKVCRASLDHERAAVYSLDREGLWGLLPSDEPDRELVNRAMREAQTCIKTAAQNTQLAKQARQQAERLVHRAFTRVGWRIKIVWVGDTRASALPCK